jgi:HSP20 family protein
VPRILLEHRDLGDDLRHILEWLEHDGLSAGAPAECLPAMDVVETASAFEIVADLPGVPPDSIRVIFSRGILVIAGRKVPGTCDHHLEAAFHLAERSFGRFARFFRLSGAVDAGAARASLRAGELRVTVPRIEERRGREIRVPMAAD